MRNRNKPVESAFAAILAKFKKKGEVVALTQTTSTGTILNWKDLEETDTPESGDTATIDGEPADGEVIVVDGEMKTTYVFEKGELKEIKEPEATDAEALKAENEQLKAELAEVTGSYNDLLDEVVALQRTITSGGTETERRKPVEARRNVSNKEAEEESDADTARAAVLARAAEVRKNRHNPNKK